MEVRIKNLTKVFKETKAIDNFSVTIPSGKLIGLLGPSGCGKSTTLFTIAGLIEPTKGEIFFGNQDVTRLSPEKRQLGLVFQNYALYPHMTVRQNILFPLENLKIPRAEAEKRVIETAKLVQLENLLDRKPAQLSGGQQQRVAIARALVKKPKVLLLDEPLSNLDARLRLQTREEIKRIQMTTGVTTIFVTHDQEEAMSVCDEIIVMKDGIFQQKAAPLQMYKNPANLFVSQFLGTPPINSFKGKIQNGIVSFNDESSVIIGKTELSSMECTVAVRPEDFIIDPNGYPINVSLFETIGRDTYINFKFLHSNTPLRAILNSDDLISRDNLRISVRKDRYFVFDAKSGVRIVE